MAGNSQGISLAMGSAVLGLMSGILVLVTNIMTLVNFNDFDNQFGSTT